MRMLPGLQPTRRPPRQCRRAAKHHAQREEDADVSGATASLKAQGQSIVAGWTWALKWLVTGSIELPTMSLMGHKQTWRS